MWLPTGERLSSSPGALALVLNKQQTAQHDRKLIPWHRSQHSMHCVCIDRLHVHCAGICRQGPESQHMWYRRGFSLPKQWAGQQILLHFGAVDWQASVWVNSVHLGAHAGG